MALFKLLKLAAIIFFFSCAAYAQRYPNQEVNKLLEVGIEYLINQNYDLARKKFDLLDKNHPTLPFGKIYLAVADITRSFDLGEEVNPSVNKNLEVALEISENLLEADPSNIWNHYFVALAKGYKAYFRVLDGDWISAFTTGLSSVNYFEDCLAMDSSFYESYIALGTYKFWKSRKLEFLQWLPFINNEAESGIRLLEMAQEKTSYNRNLASVSLIWIYIEIKNSNGAIQLAEKQLKKNPINRTLKWGLARAYEDININKAITVYNQLLDSYSKVPNQNYFQIITLKHIIAQQHLKLGEKREALRLCDEILSQQNLTEFVRERLADRLKRVKKMKQELTN